MKSNAILFASRSGIVLLAAHALHLALRRASLALPVRKAASYAPAMEGLIHQCTQQRQTIAENSNRPAPAAALSTTQWRQWPPNSVIRAAGRRNLRVLP